MNQDFYFSMTCVSVNADWINMFVIQSKNQTMTNDAAM